MTLTYSFTEEDARAAHDAWGCNCGPTALAFALQTTLEVVRPAIPDFEARGYTSPTMMRAALGTLDRGFDAVRSPAVEDMHRFPFATEWTPRALVRVAWSGPWDGMRWAGRASHWIVAYLEGHEHRVFDCNGGIMPFARWRDEIAPLLIASVKNANGNWFPLNVWRLNG
jgi:hypothetical protein